MTEDLDRLDWFDKLKAFFGTVGILGAGILILWGPEEVKEAARKEMTDATREKIGIGFLAFGTVFGLATIFASGASARSRALASRFKGLLLAGVMALLLGLSWFKVGETVQAAWILPGRGTDTEATVVSKRRVRVGTKEYKFEDRHKIAWAGGRYRKEVELPDDLRGDRSVPVVFLKDDPDVFVLGSREDGFVGLLDRNLGPWGKWAWGAAMAVMALLLLFGLKRFLFGRPRERAD